MYVVYPAIFYKTRMKRVILSFSLILTTAQHVVMI